MIKKFICVFWAIACSACCLFAWSDKTHMAIAKAAGLKQIWMAVGPDMAKLRSENERFNHWYNAEENETFTPEMVREQIDRVNTEDEKGHIFGAIIDGVRSYKDAKLGGEFADYWLGYVAHYVGDLSQPLHTIVFDEFNRSRHLDNDMTIEDEVLGNIGKIEKQAVKVVIRSEDDLLAEIVRVAIASNNLGYRMRKENRNMTRKEAYEMVGMSVGLLKAILEYAK